MRRASRAGGVDDEFYSLPPQPAHTVFEEAVRRSWKIPYVSVEASEKTPGDTAKPYDPPPEPSRRAGPSGFALCDRVSFDDGKGSTIISMVAKINRRTASVATDDGRSW